MKIINKKATIKKRSKTSRNWWERNNFRKRNVF